MYAVPSASIHQGRPVCRGSVGATLTADASAGWRPRWEQHGEIVTCPWHQLEFNVTTGACLESPRRRLPAFEMVEDGAEVKLVL